jgi:hypothetical protein
MINKRGEKMFIQNDKMSQIENDAALALFTKWTNAKMRAKDSTFSGCVSESAYSFLDGMVFAGSKGDVLVRTNGKGMAILIGNIYN